VTLLDHITDPKDIKRMSPDQLAQLADEVRERIVETVNAKGGHLGSNLGAVELTMALHRVFDSPYDMILWDTGHQAYVHKLLTGRVGDFERLREPGGMSGYPSRSESEHDWIENSHASTVLSYAYGIARGLKASPQPNRKVVAVIGDGALTGGMAFEGLNNLGHAGLDCVIVLNDNGRSYAPTISRLGESLVRLRISSTYRKNQQRIERMVRDLPAVGELVERSWDSAKAAVREFLEPPRFFEDLGVRYLGPFDGHDVGALERALESAKDLSGPTVVHVLTQKGRGYPPAEDDEVKNLHDMSDLKPGSYTAAFSEELVELARQHPELVAMTAAMPDSTGLLPMKAAFPDRVIDVGIAEQHAVTAAAGMAMVGLRPVFAVYSTFLTRAIDQVNLDVGLHEQPVIFALDRAGITGDDGASHHGILDMALLSKVPGMTIFAPSSYQELQQMFRDAVELCTEGPAAIRFPKTAAVHVGLDEVGSGLTARRVVEGASAKVALVGVGKMLGPCLSAAERLAESGIHATVWDPRVVKPLDPDMLADLAAHPLVITIEDGLREGGIGAAIADSLRDLVPVNGPCVRVLGVPVAYIPHGKPDVLLASMGLDAEGIVAEYQAFAANSAAAR
jgi:1-deoxy-D-xylulose-5-phosphate synthase